MDSDQRGINCKDIGAQGPRTKDAAWLHKENHEKHLSLSTCQSAWNHTAFIPACFCVSPSFPLLSVKLTIPIHSSSLTKYGYCSFTSLQGLQRPTGILVSHIQIVPREYAFPAWVWVLPLVQLLRPCEWARLAQTEPVGMTWGDKSKINGGVPWTSIPKDHYDCGFFKRGVPGRNCFLFPSKWEDTQLPHSKEGGVLGKDLKGGQRSKFFPSLRLIFSLL